MIGMSIKNLVVGVALLVLSTAEAQAEPFVSKPGLYSVEFPRAPEVTSIPSDTPQGTLVTWMATIDEGVDGAYLVSYADLPIKGFNRVSEEAALAVNVAGQGRRIGGTVENLTKVRLGKYSGRRFEVMRPDVHWDCLTVYVGRRLYQLNVASPNADHIAKAHSFLDSFKLLAK
jgi:hypothetical protein